MGERNLPFARFRSENFIAKDAAGITAGRDHLLANEFFDGDYPFPPTVSLNTPADAGTTNDTTPTLDFTGTEVESRDIEFEIQIGSDSAFAPGAVSKSSMTSMSNRVSGGDPTVSTVITSENAIIAVVTTQDSNTNNLGAVSVTRDGQSFTKIAEYGGSGGAGQPVNIQIWQLVNPNTGTANTVADCNGSINECTMTVYRLAGCNTSDLINNYAGGSASGTPPSLDVVTDEDSCYLIGGLVSEGTISGVGAGQDSDSSITDQSFENTRTTSKTGGAAGTNSLTFSATSQPYAYMIVAINKGSGSIVADKYSTVDTGFANPDDGGDTHPFLSGDNIQYTVQSALSVGTYYWRVRAKCPAGTNEWGSWSSTRSFVISSATTNTATVTAKSRVKNIATQTLTAKARVKLLAITKTVTAKGRVKTAGTIVTVTAKARIKKVVTQTVTAKARVKNTTTRTVTAKARVKTLGITKTVTAKARVKTAGTVVTVTAKARIKNTTSRTVTAKSRIKQLAITKTVTAKARIKSGGVTATVTAKARIKNTSTATVQAKSRVKNIVTKTVTAKARVKGLGVTKTVTAKARVKLLAIQRTVTARAAVTSATTTNTATVTAKARIKTAGTAKSVTSKARVKLIGIVKTVTSKARVKLAAITKTVTSKARVKTAGTTATVTAKTRVKRSAIGKTITAKSRVKRVAETATTTAKARIKASGTTKTAQAKARIKQVLTVSVYAKARVLYNRAVSVTAKARVRSSGTTVTISAKARVKRNAATVTISAKANIFNIGRLKFYKLFNIEHQTRKDTKRSNFTHQDNFDAQTGKYTNRPVQFK